MAFKTSFHQVDWMDDKAKKGAEEKVDKMGDSIGYPDDINDIEKENKPFFAVVCCRLNGKLSSTPTFVPSFLLFCLI